jgi:lipopolysaccharide heptosyltransferase I
MRIIIVKLSSIGDVVHALPAAAFLKRAMPESHISWVVESRASEVLKGSPVIDKLIVIDTRSWRRHLLDSRTIFEARARLGDMRQSSPRENGDVRVDVALDLQGLIKSGIVARASGALRRIGLESSDLREKASRAFLTEQVHTSGFTHVIDKNLAVARAAVGGNTAVPHSAAGFEGHEFPIKLSLDDEHFAVSAVADFEGRFAILNPGGGWSTKLWPAERFGQLADLLLQEHGLRSIVTFGPGEEHLAKEVEAGSKTGAARPLASTLKQFVALARHARLFVGGDTGPLHLAAASGTPIVGIYGPTSAERNGPFDKRDIAVGLDLWCRSSCHHRSCWHWECMDIPLGAVAKAVSVRLADAGRKDSQ